MIEVRGSTSKHTPRSQGVHLVVGSTGRVAPDGTLVQTGGGDLDLRLGARSIPMPPCGATSTTSIPPLPTCAGHCVSMPAL
jgi:hypothetical protein